jgi:hypothetical protein
MTQLASPSSTLSISLLSYLFADGRFVISGQRINRRQSINGSLESIGSGFWMGNDNLKYRLDIYRILSLSFNKTFPVSYQLDIYL